MGATGEGPRSPMLFSMRETRSNDLETEDEDTGGPRCRQWHPVPRRLGTPYLLCDVGYQFAIGFRRIVNVPLLNEDVAIVHPLCIASIFRPNFIC